MIKVHQKSRLEQKLEKTLSNFTILFHSLRHNMNDTHVIRHYESFLGDIVIILNK